MKRGRIALMRQDVYAGPASLHTVISSYVAARNPYLKAGGSFAPDRFEGSLPVSGEASVSTKNTSKGIVLDGPGPLEDLLNVKVN